MKISTEIDSAAKIIGEEKSIEYYAKAGFDAWDFSLFSMCEYDWLKHCIKDNSHPLGGNDYLKFARRLKQIGLDNGIVCNQSHAPMPTQSEQVCSYFKRAIECTAEAGGDICVIHPHPFKTAEENAEIYFELLPFAKEHNVKIATENMYDWDSAKNQSTYAACSTPDDFNAHLDAVDDEYFTACLDIGHAEMRGSETSAAEMIVMLGNRLTALHIHDNDKWHDLHQIPFSGCIDFEKVIDALKKIDYKGYFTLEASGYLKSYTKENIYEGIENLAKSAKKLVHMFDNFL